MPRPKKEAEPKAADGVVPGHLVDAMKAAEQDRRLADEMVLARIDRGVKLTQADQEEINGRRLGNDEAVRAARKRKDALERSAMPPQRRATPQGRQEV